MSVEKGAKGFQVWWRCWLLPILRKQENKRGPGSSTSANAYLMLGLPPTLCSHPIWAGSTAYRSFVKIPAYLTRTCT